METLNKAKVLELIDDELRYYHNHILANPSPGEKAACNGAVMALKTMKAKVQSGELDEGVEK